MEFNKQELKIFDEIEKIREDIKNKNIEIQYLDFGAGTPESNKTKQEMYTGSKTLKSTKNLCTIGLKEDWAKFLYKIVKENRPKIVLELGTCCGFSSIYMSKASNDTQIYTIEGAKEVAEIAKNSIQKANCTNITQIVGRFQDVLKPLLNELKEINLAFIDGHHDKNATIEYYNIIKPYLSKESIVIFDDINWSNGMKEAWEEILKDNNIKKSENLGKLGICVGY